MRLLDLDRVIEIIHLMVICHRVTLVLLLKAIIKNKHLYEDNTNGNYLKKSMPALYFLKMYK